MKYYVRDQFGNALSNVTVDAFEKGVNQSSPGTALFTGTTGSDGGVSVDTWDEGVYDIRHTSAQFTTYWNVNVKVSRHVTFSVFKKPCRVATTANITLSGTQTIDGVAVVANDRVLVKDQTTGSENGIYKVASGAWSRAEDCNTNDEVIAGISVVVTEGTVNADGLFILSTNDTIVLGTTALTFTEITGLGALSATYIVQTPSGVLTAEQALSALATGIVKNTTLTGVLSIAVAGTDYVAPNSPITGATKTKVTYDAKGLVTSGADATTSDISEGSNLYYTDARVRLNRLDQMAAPTASVSFNSQKITSLGTPTDPGDAVTKAYADALIAANDAMVYKGVINASTNPNYPAADAGHAYKISVAGKVGGASGINVEIGDLIICTLDGSASGDQATVGANWDIIQVNLDGAVIGPTSSTDGNFVLFDGATGKLIKNSTYSPSSFALVGANNDITSLSGLTGAIAKPTTITFATGGAVRTDTGSGNTLLLQAYDVDGAAYTTFGTLTAGNTPTFDLAAGVTKGGLTIATLSNKLSDFAATTSAELLSIISDETGTGSLVFGTSPSLTTPTLLGANVNIGGGASATELRFLEPSAGGTAYISFKAPALAATVNFILPNADATVSGQVLSSDAAGNLSWVTAAGLAWGATITGTSGTGITATIGASSAANTTGFSVDVNATQASSPLLGYSFTGSADYRSNGYLAKGAFETYGFRAWDNETGGEQGCFSAGSGPSTFIVSWSVNGVGAHTMVQRVVSMSLITMTSGVNNINAGNAFIKMTLPSTQSNSIYGFLIDLGTSTKTGNLIKGTGSTATNGDDKHLTLWGNTASNENKVLSIGLGTSFTETAFLTANGCWTLQPTVANSTPLKIDASYLTGRTLSIVNDIANLPATHDTQIIHGAITWNANGLTGHTVDMFDFTVSRTESRTSGTTADNYDLVYFSRTSQTTGAGGTLTAAGTVMKLENVVIQTAGTLTDTVIVQQLIQDADSTGDIWQCLVGATVKAAITKTGNLVIGTTAAGATAQGVIALSNGATAPTASVDLVHLYGADNGAGHATLALYAEETVVTETVVSDRTFPIFINGTVYKICLKV
ncbi:MAG: tail fiber protein [Siphoviridae sp. ctvD11]|nr:MAG: tail fiber protein [Siphoviridae sp. ctvD11]